MRWLRRTRVPLRLPQDVTDAYAPPRTARGGVGELAERHRAALNRGDHNARAEALWGLVAHGADAVPWCLETLDSEDLDVVEDAAGVLARIGAPPGAVDRLLERARELSDGPARDALIAALPADTRRELFAADDAAADAAPVDAPWREIWFVEAPYDDVAAAYPEWIDDRDGRFSEHRGTLNALLALLDPLVKPSWKTLCVETGSGWTAVFSQGGSGADLTFRLGARLGVRGLRTNFSAHQTDAHGVVSYGDVAFWLYDGMDLIRVVQASRQDSGWSWELQGEPQPFEELSRYEERRISRRFDRELLNVYCRALGIERDDPAYYGPRALLYDSGRRQER